MHQLFGPYWLLRRIGLGDLAEVYVATKSSPEDDAGPAGAMELVAVKRLSREMSSYDEMLELFAREGQLASRFSHPNVVRVFDKGDIGGRPYIAMEYVPGADLAHLIERLAPERLPLGPAMRIVLDLCEALQYVHDVRTDDGDEDDAGGPGRALDVVHGDITPTNILVSTGGVAKLIDFSVASCATGTGRDHTVRGTYAYMSPEQVRGETIDRRTDVFAVGVVLWELLTGRRLFRRQANYLTLAAVVEDVAPRLADLNLELADRSTCEPLDRILSRALAKDSRNRYGEVRELAADIEEAARAASWDLRPWTLRTKVRELLSTSQIRAVPDAA